MQADTDVQYAHSIEEVVNTDQFPVISIMPAIEEAQGNRTLGGPITQRWISSFVVDIYALNDEVDKLETVRDKVKAALIGFKFDSDWEPLEYAGGEIRNIQGQIILWSDTFRTETTLQYVRS